MSAVTQSVYFGLVISFAAYAAGVFIQQKVSSPIANPLLISAILIILFLELTGISYDDYNIGASYITMMLTPATAVLALQIYRELETLRRNFLPVLIGCAAGSFASMASVYIMCRAFGLDDVMLYTMLPKSVTTPIAMAVAEQLGGNASLTAAAVCITGILGAVLAPFLVRIFRVRYPVAAGVAIGTSSHALGTTRALEMGEVQGAMSGIAIGVSGLITVLFSGLY